MQKIIYDLREKMKPYENDEEKDAANREEIPKGNFSLLFYEQLTFHTRKFMHNWHLVFKQKIVMRNIHVIEKVECGCQSTNDSKSDLTYINITSKHDN